MLASALFLALVPALVAAHPTERSSPAELAPRSFQSASTTCYWQCPNAMAVQPAAGYTINNLVNSNGGSCMYLITGPSASYNGECNYKTDTGVFESVTGTGISSCPISDAQMLGYECDASAAYNGFKRSFVPRQLTEKEQIIQDRQYRPRKVAPVVQD